jgi:DNA-binding winged helix-turn-helix (wHTH) protein/tetratricopeptide (TPR) repeat protein
MRRFHFYDFDRFRIDPSERLLLHEGKPVQLTPKVFDTLVTLVENRNRLIEKDELMKAVWPDSFVAESSLTYNISILRKVLGRNDEGRSYIETVPKRGYRFIADVIEITNDDSGSSADGRNGAHQAEAAVRTIAILPFRSLMLSDAHKYLGLGMADVLITRLSNIRQLVVRPTSAVVRYDRLGQDPVAAGLELGVESVLEGTIRIQGDRTRVTVQLVDIRQKAPVWAEKFDEEHTDLFMVEDSITERLALALTLRLSDGETKLLRKHPTENIDAHHAYLKGCYYWNKQTAEGLQRSMELFEQAIGYDPDYALAYAGLANAYNLSGAWGGLPPSLVLPKAKALAQKAIEIDETLAEAHTALGGLKAMYDWDWPGAEQEFRRALEVTPSNANAHHAYAMVCLSPTGRIDEALVEVKLAHELDPLSLFILTSVGMVLNYRHRLDEAIEQFRKVIDMEASYYLTHWCLGYAYEQKGLYDEAIAAYRTATTLSGNSSSTSGRLAHLFAVLGRTQDALDILNHMKEETQVRYVSPYDVAGIYAGLGEKEEAFHWLEKALVDHSGSLVWVKLDNTFASLHSDPRFTDILGRMRLAD